MKMKKWMNVVFVLTLTTIFVSCLDNEEPYWFFYDEPAIVQYENGKPVIQTAYGTFSAPTLEKDLVAGDYLWTSFSIDMGNQPTAGDTTVTAISYKRIGGSKVKFATGDMTDDYNDSIQTSVLYSGSIIGNVYFFGFEHKAPSNWEFEYEIICNTDSVQQIGGKAVQTLYIRSKPKDTTYQSGDYVINHYGFDMTEFISKYKENNTITFNVKYKTGSDSEGKDVYKPFKSNPITLYVR